MLEVNKLKKQFKNALSCCVLIWLIVAAYIHFIGIYKTISSRNNSTSFDHHKNNCKCQSLFTIGACYKEEITTKKKISYNWNQALKNIVNFTRGGPPNLSSFMHELSRYLPSIFQDLVRRANSTSEDSTLSFKSLDSPLNFIDEFTTNQDYMREKVLALNKYISCKIHTYTRREIKTCLAERERKFGRPLRIVFLGDSQVRNLMQFLSFYLSKTLNLTSGDDLISSLNENFLDSHYKVDIPVKGDHVVFQLHWASFIGRMRNPFERTHQGAKDLLEEWAENGVDRFGEIEPDLIYFNVGRWELHYNTEVESVYSTFQNFDSILPIIQKISSRLILRSHSSFKDYASTKLRGSVGLDLLNSASWLRLRNTQVWIWDTMTPFYEKEFNECKSYWKAGLNTSIPRFWKCSDYQHPSWFSEWIASNILWNYICNDIVNLEPTYCCTK